MIAESYESMGAGLSENIIAELSENMIVRSSNTSKSIILFNQSRPETQGMNTEEP